MYFVLFKKILKILSPLAVLCIGILFCSLLKTEIKSFSRHLWFFPVILWIYKRNNQCTFAFLPIIPFDNEIIQTSKFVSSRDGNPNPSVFHKLSGIRIFSAGFEFQFFSLNINVWILRYLFHVKLNVNKCKGNFMEVKCFVICTDLLLPHSR